MTTMHLQLAITFDEAARKSVAELLGPALRFGVGQFGGEIDEGRIARLRNSQLAILGGQKPPENFELLIDSRKVAKLLQVSERTLWKMHTMGEMPPPIRIRRAVRWSIDTLKTWVANGCPPVRRNGGR